MCIKLFQTINQLQDFLTVLTATLYWLRILVDVSAQPVSCR